MLRLLACISTCGLRAAGGTAPYIPPEGPGTATLVIDNGGADRLEAATYVSSETCSAKRQIHENIRGGVQHIVKIPGGRPFTLWTRAELAFSSRGEAMGRLTGAAVCNGAMTFTPQPGRRYVVRFQMVPAKEGFERSSGSCFVRLIDEFRAADGNLRGRLHPYLWRKESACQ